MDQQSYHQFLEEKRSWYKSLGPIFCPAVNAPVHFTSKGFRHLICKGSGKKRIIKDVVRRLRLLSKAMTIIKNAQIISDNRSLVAGDFWALKGFNEDDVSEITVILRKVGGNKIIFYSVWKKR